MNIDDITYQFRGTLFEINKVLDYGFHEKVYDNKDKANNTSSFRIARRATGIISGQVGRILSASACHGVAYGEVWSKERLVGS